LSFEQSDDAGGFLGLSDDEGVVVDVEDAEFFLAVGLVLAGGWEVAGGLAEFPAEGGDQFLGFPALGVSGAQGGHIVGAGVSGELGAVMTGVDDQAAGEGAFLADREAAGVAVVGGFQVEAGRVLDGRLHLLAVLAALVEAGDEFLDAVLEGLGLRRIADLEAARTGSGEGHRILGRHSFEVEVLRGQEGGGEDQGEGGDDSHGRNKPQGPVFGQPLPASRGYIFYR
jgi:hypothetical protein